ncbi:MAG: isoprenyl transferase [Deferribacterota bacterium]|nr:isoprenyl transferase [Deferribacterota bacterium]
MNLDPIPSHVAIIMDGNGRWAKKRNLPRVAGHKSGIDVVKKIINHTLDRNIKYLTLFAFSTENWLRPKEEVEELMNLLDFYIDKELYKALEKNIKFLYSGRIGDIPKNIRKKIYKAIELSKNNNKMILNFALSYGGQEEIVDAIKKILSDHRENKIDIEDINKKTIYQYMYNPEVPDIDLLIRTSGEKRISNFMLWRLAYTELFFTNTLWPDFTCEEFDNAIEDYLNRKRRYGLIDEQIFKKTTNDKY